MTVDEEADRIQAARERTVLIADSIVTLLVMSSADSREAAAMALVVLAIIVEMENEDHTVEAAHEGVKQSFPELYDQAVALANSLPSFVRRT